MKTKRRSAKGSNSDVPQKGKLKKGAATLVRPLRVTAYESKTTKLKHSVELEVIATHYPTLLTKANPPSADHNFSKDGDPYFYEAEIEVRVSIDGQEITSFVSFQGASDLVEMGHAEIVSYLREHLPQVLGQAAIDLYKEWHEFSPRTSEVREALIARVRNEAEIAARRRLPSIKRRPITDEEFFAFVDKVEAALDQITNKGSTSSQGLKTAIAKILFPYGENPLQELQRQCERGGIDFVDLLFHLGRADLAHKVYESDQRKRKRRSHKE